MINRASLLSFVLLLLAITAPLPSQAALPWYTPTAGSPFFVLTDKQFGPDEDALLRLELPYKEAASEYGGVDVRLYRIDKPLDFLKRQKNPHRIETSANPQMSSMANTLSYLWAGAWNNSRLAWRDIFASKIRASVTATAPALRTRFAEPNYRPVPQFAPLPGFSLQREFRYPLQGAENIPVPGAKLQGSSSNFLPKNEGNFYIPLGQLPPGLYLAEAMLGAHRAVTLVFVADTVAITKLSSGEMLLWTANRRSGQPVAGANIQWTDGLGVLASGKTDAQGLLTLAHLSPERTYILGEDAAGGVFVSENFYYDSEIYATKLYAVTDRPLYRPGDFVSFKCFARTYQAATRSVPAKAADIGVDIYDPQGSQIWHGQVALSPEKGGASLFRLPENAMAGGYEMRLRYEGDVYSAAFRVAEYVKPHFEITVTPDKAVFKTGDKVEGSIHLAYPGGDPVAKATVDLTVRAQKLTMTQGELRYGGLFPIELSTAILTTDDKGEARFSLPAAKEPSRLILTLLATDGAAYRVRASRELLVERAKAAWRLLSERKFSKPGENLTLRLEAEEDGASPPASWEIIRLENQKKTTGPFDPTAREWRLAFDQPGSYSLSMRDKDGNLVAAAAHWVSGDGLQVIPGVIEMVTDKERYKPGETAEVLVSFSEPVDEALLTLERDKVERTALLSHAADAGWLKAERLAPNQWKLKVPVEDGYAPNITLSAVYVKNGEYVFQNAGIVAETPRIELTISPSVQVAKPGDTVTVDIAASYRGQPARAMLTVSVVDEMIYALQAEIAPEIGEFFQHIRRNNVRTGASLSFITYDQAVDYSGKGKPPARHQYNERGVKVLERARRDDIDTAAWLPTLLTGDDGHASFSFRMPDALSRWRITARAVTLAQPAGQNDLAYGQKTGFIRSDKAIYSKWTAPTWLRQGDAPIASLALFNNGDSDRQAEVILWLGDQESRQKVTLARGVTYLPFALPSFSGTRQARLEVRQDGMVADALDTAVTANSPRWRGAREELAPVINGEAALHLPTDASNLRLRLLASGQEHFARIADSLVEYPWGCVEQTASRLIPLAIAAPLLFPDNKTQGEGGRLWQTLASERLRLTAMAGPKAVFGWWGDGTKGDLLMTAYAYYADHLAATALGLTIPSQHWQHLLEVYSEAANTPILHRALALWFAQNIGLPVRTQIEGVAQKLSANPPANSPERPAAVNPLSPYDSVLLADPDSELGLAYARILTAAIAEKTGTDAGVDFKAGLDKAAALLTQSALPSAKALLLLAGRLPAGDAPNILAKASAATPTLDRALTLLWTRQALNSGGKENSAQPVGDWLPIATESLSFTGTAAKTWHWPDGKPLPESLRLRNLPATPLVASLRFDAEEQGKTTLPVTISRTLYRLDLSKQEAGRSTFTAVPVASGETLSTRALYLDEIRVAAQPGAPLMRYGLVEAPLPPGAAIETGTWGVNITKRKDEEAQPLNRSRAQEQRGLYGVAVDALDEQGITLRHLLRLSEGGRFTVPAARYHRMYQPEAKAYAGDGQAEIWQVR